MLEQLSDSEAAAVLTHLNVAPDAPSPRHLARLMAAYACQVPWETASRIVNKAETAVPAQRPRFPHRFWQENQALGTGGTCFESNAAMWALLQALGYDAALTINDMGETIGCHTAIVVRLDGQPWLVDAGYPIYAPLPLHARAVVHRATPFIHYTVQPLGDHAYEITNHPHPKPYMFTLRNTPVSLDAYGAATSDDYGDNGYFLDVLIVKKVVNGRPAQFNSRERPFRLEVFENGRRTDTPLTGDIPAQLAAQFQMDAALLRRAWRLVVS